MTFAQRFGWAALGLTLAAGAACAGDEGRSAEENLTSESAVFLELAFEGEVVVPTDEDASQRRKRYESQMFYLAGELDKAHGAHGQFGFVEVEELGETQLEDGLTRVTYMAKLPVAWPKRRDVPETYRVVMPKRLDAAGLSDFNAKYAHTPCAKAKYGDENLWYDFKPVSSPDCELDADDVVDVEAAVAESPYTTQGRYPDYPAFWDDGEFRMVLVHGTDSASSEDPSDFIAAAYIDFKRRLQDRYPDATITEGDTSYSIYDDWQLEAKVTGYGGVEGKIIVNALLTSPLKYIGAEFDERYAEISGDADLIAYGGHSGLSKNIKALARKGVVKEQKHQVVLMQGCSTFAYLDRSIADRRVEVNGEDVDPDGINFLDLVVTAQPAYAYTNAPTFFTLLTTLSGEEAKTYDEIVAELPQQAIPVIAAEEDNPTETP